MTGARSSRWRVALVGPGRAGRAFARSWTGAGGRIADRRSAASRAERVPAVRRRRAGRAGRRDRHGRRRARAPAALPFRASPLGRPRERGPRAACRAPAPPRPLHPVRPFTGAADEDWRGAFVAVEGDARRRRAARRSRGRRRAALPARRRKRRCTTPRRRSRPEAPPPSSRSPSAAGWPPEFPRSVARETLAGLASRATAAVGARTFPEAFTGAVARRDVGTVRAHVAALAADSRSLALYRALAEEILRRTEAPGARRRFAPCSMRRNPRVRPHSGSS